MKSKIKDLLFISWTNFLYFENIQVHSQCFHLNFYTFPLIPIFSSVAHIFNVFFQSMNMQSNLQTKSEQKR